MKKHLAALAVTTVLAGGFTVAVPTATQAAEGGAALSARAGCVTKAEFKKAKKRMTVKKVAKIFGTNGKRESIAMGGGYRFEVRSYKTCTPYGAVAIGYSNGKLDNKTGIF